MNRHLTVTIGISARNEAGGIASLLRSLLAQQQREYTLERIILADDASSDNTIREAESLKDPRITILHGAERKGKAFRINEICRRTSTDILVILDADITLASDTTIANLIQPFTEKTETMLTSGRALYAKPKTLVQHIAATGCDIWEDVKKEVTQTLMYRCEGTIRAMRKQLYQKIVFPMTSADDVYPYLFCAKRGYAFTYCSNAIVYYTLPATYKDYRRQQSRFLASPAIHERHFGKRLVHKHFVVTAALKLRVLARHLVRHPLKTSLYLLGAFWPKLISKIFRYHGKTTWHIATSTKTQENPKDRIIFSTYDSLLNSHYAGGGAVAIHNVARELTSSYHVTVIAGAYPGCRSQQIDGIWYRYIGISWGGPRLGQIIHHLLLPFYVTTMRFDVWIESFTPPFSTSFLQLFTKKPVIGLVHMLAGKDMQRKYKVPFFHWIEKLGLTTYRHFIVLTEQSRHLLQSINPTAHIDVIPNGTNIPREQASPEKSEHILFVGRIEIDQKGIDLLIEAYASIQHYIAYPLVIAGSGTHKEEQRLRNLIKDLSLENRVQVIGRVTGKHKENLYRKAAFVVLPSRFETFSMVALEAMSHQKALVSFSIDGFRWIPDEAALKAQAFDVRSLAAAMLKLAQDTPLRNRMGHSGYQYIKNQNWHHVAQAYHDSIATALVRESRTEPNIKVSKHIPHIIDEIIAKKTPCIFISPHLDDAILSAGDLIAHLSDKTSVHVVTLFTEASDMRSTLSGYRFVRQCGYRNARSLFAARRIEDSHVLDTLGVKHTHLGFTDGTWRMLEHPSKLRAFIGKYIPEFMHVYPTHKFHISSGKIAPSDKELFNAIEKRLREIVESTENAVIFGPQALGNHVDHVITRRICQNMFDHVLLWADYPYNLHTTQETQTTFSWSRDMDRKQDLIRVYQSQVRAMFPHGDIRLSPEHYYATEDKAHI